MIAFSSYVLKGLTGIKAYENLYKGDSPETDTIWSSNQNKQTQKQKIATIVCVALEKIAIAAMIAGGAIIFSANPVPMVCGLFLLFISTITPNGSIVMNDVADAIKNKTSFAFLI